MIAGLVGNRSRVSDPSGGEWPLVAHIGPQPAGLGLAGARRQRRYWRVVDIKGVAAEDVGSEGVDQCFSAPPSLQPNRCFDTMLSPSMPEARDPVRRARALLPSIGEVEPEAVRIAIRPIPGDQLSAI